jgi:phosphoenolpyruvate carboxykinase (ATP)
VVQTPTKTGLEQHGIYSAGKVHWNLSAPSLYEASILRGQGKVAQNGPLVFRTAPFTGRSPKDKFVVREPSSESNVWWGSVNQPLDPAHFDALKSAVIEHLSIDDIFVQDLYVGAASEYRMPIRVISELPYHSLFARNMFIRPPLGSPTESPQFTVIAAPSYNAAAERFGLRSSTFIVLNFAERVILIGGTSYAGEIKKSIFSVLNYLLPLLGVFSMHCSANRSIDGSNVALFFGLSGTGKTTLSTVGDRILIGDDEHGWSDDGVFNYEGGSYAKTIRISSLAEPEIYSAVHRFGTVLENVVIDDETRLLNLDSDEYTENTRAAYPIDFLPNVDLSGQAGHPQNVIFLTADAFGVLPPVARLTPEQAGYYYLSGYTAKVAGTERGVTEPEPNFSTCFGSPFLTLPPQTYARLLGDRIAKHKSRVWLVNTGWTGGPYGTGKRIDINSTRSMVAAILGGQLDTVTYHRDQYFGIEVPDAVPGVAAEILQPRQTWSSTEEYDQQASKLTRMFVENFKKFGESVPTEIREAGPNPN